MDLGQGSNDAFSESKKDRVHDIVDARQVMKFLRIVLLLFIFGLSPLWISVAVVVLWGTKDRSSLAVSPWLIVASLGYCVFTLILTGAAMAVYNRTDGDRRRKALVTVAFVALVLGLLIVSLGIRWFQHEREEAKWQRGSEVAQEFARDNPVIRLSYGGDYLAHLDSYQLDRDARMYYVFSIQPVTGIFGQRSRPLLMWAIIDVADTKNAPEASLRCVLPDGPGYLNYNDPCVSFGGRGP